MSNCPYSTPAKTIPLLVDDEWYAVEVSPGYEGRFGGPPDCWEPPEPAFIEEVYRLADETWATVEYDYELDSKIWKALDQKQHEND